MCVVSMITDHYRDKWYPYTQPGWTNPVPMPNTLPLPQIIVQPSPVSAEEVVEFRRLLERAREYDKRNNEPECELTEKREALKAIAKVLGIDISFIDEAVQ